MGVALSVVRLCGGLFLCRCGALWGDLRGGFLVAGVVVRGVLFRGVCGHLVASGGVSCGVSCGGLFVVVSWGRLVGRLGLLSLRLSCRVAGRLLLVSLCGAWGGAGVALCVVSCGGEGGGAGVSCGREGAGPVFSLSVISPPAPGKGCRVVSAGGGRFFL